MTTEKLLLHILMSSIFGGIIAWSWNNGHEATAIGLVGFFVYFGILSIGHLILK